MVTQNIFRISSHSCILCRYLVSSTYMNTRSFVYDAGVRSRTSRAFRSRAFRSRANARAYGSRTNALVCGSRTNARTFGSRADARAYRSCTNACVYGSRTNARTFRSPIDARAYGSSALRWWVYMLGVSWRLIMIVSFSYCCELGCRGSDAIVHAQRSRPSQLCEYYQLQSFW